MNLILAVVRPSRVDEIKDALAKIDLPGFTVTDVRGHGRQKGHKEIYRGAEYEVDLLPKAEIKVIVPAERTEEVVGVISAAARTGKIGDGKIFVLPVSQVVRIRTGEKGPAAL